MPDARAINEPVRAPTCPAYRQQATGYDEMCTGEGEVRSHWRYLVNALEGMGPQTLAQRQRDTTLGKFLPSRRPALKPPPPPPPRCPTTASR